MRAHVKSVLNISTNNFDDAIENNLMPQLNLENPNPTYIFILPEFAYNRTIKLHRSDFLTATYPNISYGKRIYKKNSFGIHFDVFDKHSMSFEEIEMLNNIQSQKIFQNDFNNFEFDQYSNVINENLRTERNFVRMMVEVNNYPETFTEKSLKKSNVENEKHLKNSNYKYSFQQSNNHKDNVDWNSLGLEGWSGGLSEGKPKDNRLKETSYVVI